MPAPLETIVQLQVPVIVEIGRMKMPLDDVLALAPGAIIELDKPAEEELSLLINNKPIGRGVAVKVNENFGLRITSVGPAAQRVQALGPGEAA